MRARGYAARALKLRSIRPASAGGNVRSIGSENFGLAIVYGRSKEVKGRAAVVCVVNKKNGAVELGTEMSNDIIRVRKPKDDDKGDTDDGGQSGAE